MRYLSQQPMSSIIPPEELLVVVKKGPILSRTNRQYLFEIKLPDFIALNLDDCGIIDLGYFLKVTKRHLHIFIVDIIDRNVNILLLLYLVILRIFL